MSLRMNILAAVPSIYRNDKLLHVWIYPQAHGNIVVAFHPEVKPSIVIYRFAKEGGNISDSSVDIVKVT
jgi:hypothetical protein